MCRQTIEFSTYPQFSMLHRRSGIRFAHESIDIVSFCLFRDRIHIHIQHEHKVSDRIDSIKAEKSGAFFTFFFSCSMYSNRITRQLTVNLDQQHINVRPIIKGWSKIATCIHIIDSLDHSLQVLSKKQLIH